MKNIIKISAFACAALVVLGITGCAKEELDTAQYSESAVTLSSYGPNPVMRGAQLRFFGSNLQNIVEVNVPGLDPITEIEVVESGKVSEIRVALPVEGPEVGIVSIKTKDGQTLKTKSELTYIEPIVFESFSAEVPAYPGDVVTLTGDYMYLVKRVIFEGGEAVDVQEGATRHEAKVTIPATAVTGKIILSDGAEVENLLYSEKELTIGWPTVTKLSKMNVKPGDEIVFQGSHLEMIKAIQFDKSGGVETVEDFVFENGKITVAVPDVAVDCTVSAVTYAENMFEICEIACIMPSELAVTNTPKAGTQLVITGKDLDVVSKVDLAGAAGAAFELKDGKLNVTVPATATEGAASLFHPNGESVSVDYTLVHPTITEVAPIELFAGDEPVTVTGTDLDLVTKAKIGTKDVEITAQTETSLTLATNVTSVGGKVILTLANGETIESTEEVVMKYHSKVILTSRPDAEHIGMPVVLKGQGLDLVESIFIGDVKVTKYILRTADEIQFLMPWNKIGSYELKFQLYDGDIEIQADPIEVLLELQIIVAFEGSVDIAWSAPGQIVMPASSVGKVTAGSIIRIYFTQHDQVWGQIQVNDGSWVKIVPEIVPTDVYGWFPDGILDRVYDIVLTQAMADQINATDGLVIQGSDETVTKVEIINEISQEVILWEGEAIADNWADQPNLLSDAGLELADAGATAGQEVRFYLTPLADLWKLQIVEGHWGPTYCSYCAVGADTESGKFTEYDLAAHGGFIPLTLTQEMLDAAFTKQWWGGTFIGNGDKVKITKITLL